MIFTSSLSFAKFSSVFLFSVREIVKKELPFALAHSTTIELPHMSLPFSALRASFFSILVKYNQLKIVVICWPNLTFKYIFIYKIIKLKNKLSNVIC